MRGGRRSAAGRPMIVVSLVAAVTVLLLGGAGARAATRNQPAAKAQPTFANFAAPSDLGQDSGEPSIGVDRATGNVMFQAGLETLRVSGFDPATGRATWESVGAAITSHASLDPILFTDPGTNRTFVSQLAADCSLMAYTDDDGATWVQNPIGCGPGVYVDHQTVGGGPYAPPLVGTPAYADATYYCAQAAVEASCAISPDGGLTFDPAVPIYTTECIGLHGHLKVAPDGTAYVPNMDCGGKQGMAVSTNDGATWTVQTIPGTSTQDESDPSIGIGSGGTAYFGFQDGDGHAKVAVSHDRGQTWTTPIDLGTAFGIQNSQFPEVVAGDDDRAAVAFLGTPTAGNDQAASFNGVWHLYVATTYDGGATWTTVDATPTDPVQRGCIWLNGGSNPCRNLLDFNDMTIDKTGQVVVGYADGCTGSCATGGTNTHSSVATIAYQSGGLGLFKEFDPAAPGAPGNLAAKTAKKKGVMLSWSAPVTGGSATGYRIYRGTWSGGETLLTSVGLVTTFKDTKTVSGTRYYYTVAAIGPGGEGPASSEASAVAK